MTDSGRSMALDVGERRIGVAISDPLGLLARGLTTILRKNSTQAVADIAALVQEWQPSVLVIGLPRNMDDTLGPQAERVQAFARALAEQVKTPLVWWDERLSTVNASEILSGQGVRSQDQKGRIDAVAAAVILQAYLDAQRTVHGVSGLLTEDTAWPEDGGRRTVDRRRKKGRYHREY